MTHARHPAFARRESGGEIAPEGKGRLSRTAPFGA
jgi:hypothetical protein